MKRFAREPKAKSSPRAAYVSRIEAFSHQLDDTADTACSEINCWQAPLPIQISSCVPTSPCTAPFRDEMYVLYTVKHLCKGPLAMIYSNVLLCNPSGQHPYQSMMNHCLLAMAKVFYGLQNRESRVLRDGMCLYGQGLRILREVLSKISHNITMEMVISSFALYIGKVYTPPDQMRALL